MKKLAHIIAILCITVTSYSQCNLLTETKSYEAICFKKLSKDNRTTNSIEISIAKNGNSGYLVIKLQWTDSKFHKNVILYLDDNTAITLINKNLSWKVNGNTYGQYDLTAEEIKRLKNANIRALRYWTCSRPEMSDCDDAKEYYNVEFKDTLFNKIIERVDFPKLISDLFE